jgi:TonB family protein
MNRLQKKCAIVTAGIHLLLLLILIVGPAFFSPKPPPDDLAVIDVIPATLVDAPFNSGVANATPPPPAPVVTPPPPVPVVTPPPVPDKVVKTEPVKPPDKLAPDNLKPVTRTVPKNPPPANNSQQQQRRALAIRTALKNLKHNLTSSTTVDMPGNSSVAYANYSTVVRSIYDEAWTLPDHIANDEEIIKVSVTIASDGTVITARIVSPSGDANVDASVQRALERVKFIAPFPEGATEKEREYIINFNPKTKKMLE